MAESKQLPHHDAVEWNGYTLDEIRYARAYTAARIELSRGRLLAKVDGVRKSGFAAGGMQKNLFSRLLGAFGYIDVAIFAWRIGRKLFRVTRAIKGR